MKVKLGELLNCSLTRTFEDGTKEFRGLAKILASDIHIKIQHRLFEPTEVLDVQVKRFQELNKKLIEKLGEDEYKQELDDNGEPKLDDNGEPVMVKTGNKMIKNNNLVIYNEEIKQLLEEEIEIHMEPISIEDLGDIKVTRDDLIMIKPFIKELNKENKPDLKVIK